MKKLTLLLVFALLITTILASCSGNYDDPQAGIEEGPGADNETGEKNDVDVKYDLEYKGYTYNIYDGKEIEITGYDFEYTEESEDNSDNTDGSEEDESAPAADDDAAEDTETVKLELTIPDKINDIPVTKIAKGAFEKNSVLGSVVIPEGVLSVGDEAFWFNSALESVVLPDSLTALGNRVFNYCTSLTSIDIPANITVIPEALCGECTSLVSVVFEGDVTEIGKDAFAYCTSLTSIDLGDALVSVGNNAFKWCRKITEITLPETVKTVGVGAFSYCELLASLSFGQIVEIGESAFECCSALTAENVSFTGTDSSSIVVGKFNDVIVDALA